LNALELHAYLHGHIPLVRAMAVEVHSIGPEGVVLGAPLAPNTNHHETVFGGSASALAILAAWSCLHLRLAESTAPRAQLVIQRNTMEYLKPVSDAFTARASLLEGEDWARFMKMLERKSRARISVLSVLESGGAVAGRLVGEFVALLA
jgi:thioesterase domain-containing protein